MFLSVTLIIPLLLAVGGHSQSILDTDTSSPAQASRSRRRDGSALDAGFRHYSGGTQHNHRDIAALSRRAPTTNPLKTLPAGVTAVGCFVDAGRARFVLSSVSTSSAMTPSLCVQNCKNKGYTYAGAQNAAECYCSNQIDATLRQADSVCSTACAGDSGYACGGGGVMMVYSGSNQPSSTTTAVATSTAKPLPAGVAAVGCFVDAGRARFVLSTVSTSSAMTPSLCVQNCKVKGYTYAGAQNAAECYCSNQIDATLKQADSVCSTPCTGDSGFACGGGGVMMVYSGSSQPSSTTTAVATPTASPVPSGIVAVGCFVDAGRAGFVLSTVSTSPAMTPSLCVQTCKDKGYTYAGAQNARECYCSNQADATLKQADSFCTTPCAGDSGFKCGGGGVMMVYSGSTTPSTSSSTTPPSVPTKALAAGVKAIGCFGDANSMSFVLSSVYSTSAMTPSLCTQYCKDRAYTLAGIQGGNQCYCSNQVNWSLKAADTECSLRCAGDGGYACGGSGRMMVYSSSSEIITGTPQPVSAGRKWLWSHYMVGNTENHTPQIWEEDIRLAAAAGIDGFALNMGQAAFQVNQAATAYQTAYNLRATYAFKLFLSFDMTAMRCQNTDDAQYLAGIVKQFASNPYQAMYQGKVLVTTFAGDQCQFNQGSALAGWNFFRSLLSNQGISIYLMPSLFVNAYGSANAWYDGHFDWDSAWPLTSSNLDGSRDQANLATLNAQGKGYMANISPAFFTYYGTSGQFAYNKNWIYRSDNWLLATRFETLMGMRAQLDMIELTSWNDFGESHHIGPIRTEQPGSQGWVNGLPHTAWLNLIAYYAPAWKTGAYPTAPKDQIIIWSRTHPKNGTPTNPTLSRPRDADWTDDNLYALVILASSATVDIISGDTTVSYPNLPAGVSKISLASRSGIIGGQITRNGQRITRWTSEGVFSWSTTFRDWNFNYFVQAF